MDIAREQATDALRSAGRVFIQTAPTFSVVVWIVSKAVGLGFGELLVEIATLQPMQPLLELILGAI